MVISLKFYHLFSFVDHLLCLSDEAQKVQSFGSASSFCGPKCLEVLTCLLYSGICCFVIMESIFFLVTIEDGRTRSRLISFMSNKSVILYFFKPHLFVTLYILCTVQDSHMCISIIEGSFSWCLFYIINFLGENLQLLYLYNGEMLRAFFINLFRNFHVSACIWHSSHIAISFNCTFIIFYSSSKSYRSILVSKMK